jgi:hypothetical protein
MCRVLRKKFRLKREEVGLEKAGENGKVGSTVVCTLPRCYSGDEIEQNEMHGACRKYWVRTQMHTRFRWGNRTNTLLGSSRSRWDGS